MDTFFKKEVIYPYKGINFSFDVANELFSTFSIDHGTDMLLRHIVIDNPKNILDIGCGYGPMGICLAKTNPQSHVVMVDSDLLAIRYAKINIDKNHVTNAIAVGSVGIEAAVDTKFDLIVSNIPAKIGDKAIIEEFILKPLNILTQDGSLVIVIVTALNHIIPILKGKYTVSVSLVRKRKGHFLYQIKKNSK